MKRLAILGSTGSIGRQTLEVVEAHPSLFSINVLAAHSQSELLIEQIIKWHPKHVFITDDTAYQSVRFALQGKPIKVHPDWSRLPEVLEDVDFVLGAISGAAGILPTLMALEQGLSVGLANKETLVAAGDLVAQKLIKHGGQILPVDSEHSAIFQCLQGQSEPRRLILTASGGPFRTWKKEHFSSICLEDALSHPNWKMGKKITIDSSTLMNKGLEVIEAQRLFQIPIEQIDVVIHPESIIHSMVEFNDGSVLAQLGNPDMRLPIQYALTWPERQENDFKRLDFSEITSLHFEEPRWNDFPALKLAYEAGQRGGSAPIILNAANEAAVNAFIQKRIQFIDIVPIVESALGEYAITPVLSLDHLLEWDQRAREYVEKRVSKVGEYL